MSASIEGVELTTWFLAEANRMCPMYNANSGPSPAATTPGAGTPGVYGMTYGSASHEGSMPPPQEAPTSLKIRLGTGRG